MALLNQLTMSQMLQMLTQNPNTVVFGLTTTDYPNGITRVALLAAYKLIVQQNGNFDSVTGSYNSQVYAPGILLNGGGQIPASPAANMTPAVTPLPVITVNGAAAQGSSPAIITTP